MADLGPFAELLDRLEIEFKRPELLLEALTHRSWLNENEPEEHVGQNERLEFLGDTVIDTVVTDFLFDQFPHEPEGVLTEMRSKLVRMETLAIIGRELGLNNLLRRSRGEAMVTEGRSVDRLMANTFEALIGAIYKDQGIGQARLLLDHLLIRRFRELLTSERLRDYKNEFQEATQGAYGITPRFRTISETGPDHKNKKQFVVEVYAAKICERGQGASKKAAQVDACRTAFLKHFGGSHGTQ